MTLKWNDQTGSTITPTDSLRIVQALNRLPYAAPVHVPGLTTARRRDEPVTVDMVVEYLERFAEILEDHAKRHNTLEAEHRALVSDLRAVRRVLGTSPVADPCIICGANAPRPGMTVCSSCDPQD